MGSRNNYPPSSWDIFSLGNLGYSSAGCSSSSLFGDNFKATCNTGTIATLEYVELLPSDAKSFGACKPNTDTQY